MEREDVLLFQGLFPAASTTGQRRTREVIPDPSCRIWAAAESSQRHPCLGPWPRAPAPAPAAAAPAGSQSRSALPGVRSILSADRPATACFSHPSPVLALKRELMSLSHKMILWLPQAFGITFKVFIINRKRCTLARPFFISSNPRHSPAALTDPQNSRLLEELHPSGGLWTWGLGLGVCTCLKSPPVLLCPIS